MTIAIPWNERVVEGDGGCLLWQGAVNSKGYGCIARDGRIELVHRVAYEDTIGPIPAGHQIHHRCSTPLCVNPLHLEALSARDHHRTDRTALTVEQVRVIKRRPYESRSALAERFGVSVWTIAEIRKGRTWKDVA